MKTKETHILCYNVPVVEQAVTADLSSALLSSIPQPKANKTLMFDCHQTIPKLSLAKVIVVTGEVFKCCKFSESDMYYNIHYLLLSKLQLLTVTLQFSVHCLSLALKKI